MRLVPSYEPDAPKTLSDTELDDALLAAVGKYAPMHPEFNLPPGVSASQAAYYVEYATGVPMGTPSDRKRVRAALGRLVEAARLTYLDTIKTVTVRLGSAQDAHEQRASKPMRRWHPG